MHLSPKPRGRSLAPLLILLATLVAALLGPATSGAMSGASNAESRQLRLEERLTRRAQRQSERESRHSERETRHDERAQPATSGCGVTITPSAARVIAGATVALSGSVICPAQPATSDPQIEIYEQAAGSHLGDAAAVQTLTAAEDGSFETTSAPLTANTVFRATLGSVQTRVAVKVAPAVTLSASAAPQAGTASVSARTRRTQTLFSGTVTPALPGALVALQVSAATSGRWRTIGWTHTDEEGAYSIARVLHSLSAVSVRTLVHPRSHLSPGVSEQLSLQGSQPQRSGLTIGTSSDPVVDGEAVKISGVAAGGAGVAVKLLGQQTGGGWAVLGEATTDEGGGYSFDQSPSETTLFRVTDATASSTVLKQRVALTLSPQALPASATAGELVTFSLTAAHAPSGTPVVLEALGATGLNFRVVATSATGPTGEASITHAFSAGVYTLRLRLPGSDAYSSVAGTPFVLNVTP